MVRISSSMFTVIFTSVALSAFMAILAFVGILSHRQLLTTMGVAVAVVASWVNVMVLAIAAGNQSRNK